MPLLVKNVIKTKNMSNFILFSPRLHDTYHHAKYSAYGASVNTGRHL